MKKVLGIMAIVAVSALMLTSCGKTCNCTHYEDGKKIYVVSSAQSSGTKYFTKDACKYESEKYQDESDVVEGKLVTKQIICK